MVSKAEIRDDTTKSRSGRLQNAMKVHTEIQDISKSEKPKLEVMTSIKEGTMSDNIEHDNTLDGENIVTYDEKKKRLIEIEKSEPKVILEISNKTTIQGIKVAISCTGIENSLRNERDGITYFGCFNDDKVTYRLLYI
jgi:hypothetical protein